MSEDLITRRTALKYAGLIALAARAWRGLPGYSATFPPHGYGTDPDVLKRPVTWPRSLSQSQLAMLTALCDIVLPAEPPHPSAGMIEVPEFIDEWASAPYPQMQADRVVILDGLEALGAAMHKARGVPFTEANLSHQIEVFDQLCGAESTARFSRRLIELICAGYYTTREGHAAIGYVGNVAQTSFPGPPPEVLRHLEEALTELLRTSTLKN